MRTRQHESAATPYSTLVDLLRARAEQRGDEVLFRYLTSGDVDGPVDVWSYRRLDHHARALGTLLGEEGAFGERVLLLYPPGLDFIAAFLGCLFGGAVAVPCYPPDPARLDRSLPRLRAIARDSGARFILTPSGILEWAEPQLLPQAPELGGLRWLASDRLPEGLATAFRRPDISGDTVALLQYTSGSTGDPRGVRLSHANVLHNEACITRFFGVDAAASSGVGWLPLFHDMGLIGNVLQPLYLGFPCTLMSPLDFLQRPLRWLEAISHSDATLSGGPNFAYELCARKATGEELAGLDLQSWELAFCGAEPIRRETLERFARTFAPSGFRREALYPCYGLAEATLIVSGGRKGTPFVHRHFATEALERGRAVEAPDPGGASRSLVSSGCCAPDQQVRVVHPETRAACAPGEVGELWVSGPSVARGYWNRPGETEVAFGARLASGEGPFLRTGDLGFLDARGELFVTGRLKDLIILRGRNLYPQDIEQTVERAHPGLRAGACAAFPLEVDGEERLAVAAEVGAREGFEPAAVMEAIREAVLREHDARLDAVVLLRPRTLPKTSSGKVQRRACRAAFLAGELELVASDLPGEPGPAAAAPARPPVPVREALAAASAGERPALLERLVRGEVARVLGTESVRPDRPLAALGLDSLGVLELQGRLEAALGLALPSAFLWQQPSLEAAALRLLEVWQGGGSGAALLRPPSVEGPGEGELPLSSGQLQLWFLDRLVPGSALYNVHFGLRMTGPLDKDVLRRGLDGLLRRHAVLRASFPEEEGLPRQRLGPPAPLALRERDLRGLAGPEREAGLRRVSLEHAREPFELATGPLVRACLVALGEQEHVLLMTQHHIVTDGWSLGVLARELAARYRAALRGAPASLPAPSLQYVDYARWQRGLGDLLEGQRAWWGERLAGLPRLELPADRPSPKVATFQGATHAFTLSLELTLALEALGRREGCTLFVTLAAAYAVLLHRYSGQEDFAVGTVVANRDRPELRDVVGFFASTLVLRADLSGVPTFRELLSRVRRIFHEALAHAALSFEEVVGVTRTARGGWHPLFQASFVLESLPPLELAVPGMAWRPFLPTLNGAVEGTARADLGLVMAETPEGLAGAFEFRTDLFDAATLARLSGHFEQLLRGAVEDPERRVAELPLLTDPERRALRVEWNDTRADLPDDARIHVLFEAQAQRTPEALAACFGEASLTYRELDRRANQLASHLRALGVGPEVCVGLCLERSLELVVGMLGILKAGGAYVPLDPSYPADRLAFMARDCMFPVLVTQQHLADALPSQGEVLVCLDSDADPLSRQPTGAPASGVTPDNLAYVLYTSGSTGQPKGTLLQHRGLCNTALAAMKAQGLSSRSRVLQFAASSFDASVWEVFSTLLAGACLVLAPREQLLPNEPLRAVLENQRIAAVTLTPSVLAQLDSGGLPLLETVVSAGEALPPELAHRWTQAGRTVLNAYGPTEVTVCATITPGCVSPERVTLGRPWANVQVYVLDAHLQPVPVGIPGELCVGGVGLARGYLHRPELTAERFIPNPFSDVSGARLYRTGDRARFLADGQLEYLGRLDAQIKLRGIRIESGEIETVLRQHPAVRDVVVVAREDVPGDRRLVAYLVASAPAGVPEDLQTWLRERLPEPLVPSTFVILEALPLSLHGKVDRRSLPIPTGASTSGAAYVEPQAGLEALLAGIWRSVLNVEQVGAHDDFFERGGHSLLATQVASRVRAALHVELPLSRFFETPTVAGQARAIAELQAEQEEAYAREILERIAGLSDEELERELAVESGKDP